MWGCMRVTNKLRIISVSKIFYQYLTDLDSRNIPLLEIPGVEK